jgi:hypothetical protein
LSFLFILSFSITKASHPKYRSGRVGWVKVISRIAYSKKLQNANKALLTFLSPSSDKEQSSPVASKSFSSRSCLPPEEVEKSNLHMQD